MVVHFYQNNHLDFEKRSADRTVPSVLQQGREMTRHQHESRPSCYVLSEDHGVGHSGLLLKPAGVEEACFLKCLLGFRVSAWPEQLCRPREHAVLVSPAAMEWMSHAGRVLASSELLIVSSDLRSIEMLQSINIMSMFFKVKMRRISLSTPTQSWK